MLVITGRPIPNSYLRVTPNGTAFSFYPQYSVTSLTWSATNGGQVAVVLGAASLVAAAGATVYITGVAGNTGIGDVGLINAPQGQLVNTWTNSQHFTFLLPGTAAQWGTLSGTILLNYRVAPAGAKVAVLSKAGAVTYFTDDGSTPSAANGVTLPVGTVGSYLSDFTKLQLFAAGGSGGTIDVAFYGN
jgi:hypothetical protein